MENAIYLSLVTASISFTVSETKIFKPLREWLKTKVAFLGELLSCGYCLGTWIALILVVLFRARLFESWWPLDYLLTALFVSWLSAFQWGVMCLLMQKTGK
jgi:hypothetical protein